MNIEKDGSWNVTKIANDSGTTRPSYEIFTKRNFVLVIPLSKY